MKTSTLAAMASGALALLMVSGSLQAETEDDRMEWFRDAKFGMFIHFGAPEYEQDENLSRAERHAAAVRDFNPVDFDAREWLQIAKDGGAKYIVFTTKHHDGFCKWDSALTDWDVVDATPFKRDIVGELAEACQETGLRLGCYYSIGDWHHPEYDPFFSNRRGFHYAPNPEARITEYMKYMYGQIEELCAKYQPSLFWFDGSSGFRPAERKRLLGQQDLMDLLHSYGAISNSRLGDDDSLRFVDYLSMGDNQAPAGNIGVDFEAAGTMNESWHYRQDDDDYKPVDELLERLVTVVGNGGNYLLNVGPDGKGVIPEASVKRLQAMGEWLEENGQAIYGTRAGPHPHGFKWGSITQRTAGSNTKLYLNVVHWPEDGQFHLYGLDNKILSASLLVGGKTLAHTSSFDAGAGVRRHSIAIPRTAPNRYVSVIALTVEGEASMEQVHLQQNDGSVFLDGYKAIIHDTTFVSEKPRRPLDFKEFTVPQGGDGIVPARMLTIGGFDSVGQALTWDFRLVEPGTYEVAVVTLSNGNDAGRLRATIAGKSVEGALVVREKMKSIQLPSHLLESLSVLGTVTIPAAGMQTLALEVTQDFADSGPGIRSVRLLPVNEGR